MTRISNHPRSQSKKKFVSILIIDDSPYNLFVLEEMITSVPNVSVLEQALNG